VRTLKKGRHSWQVPTRAATARLDLPGELLDYDGGTETITIFVIGDDRCHARKGSIEAFWVGFRVKLHASLLEYGRVSTCS
jgi:hypothetical protein